MRSHPPTTSLSEFRADCAGQPYRSLVELYAVRYDARGLAMEVEAALGAFPSPATRPAERLYNVWNFRGQVGSVPDMDCAQVVDRVVEDARRMLPGDVGDEVLLRAFRLVTLGLALTATIFPGTRRRMEIHTAEELTPGSPPPDEG